MTGWLSWYSVGLQIQKDRGSNPVRGTRTFLWVFPSQKCCADSLSVCPAPVCRHKNDHVLMGWRGGSIGTASDPRFKGSRFESRQEHNNNFFPESKTLCWLAVGVPNPRVYTHAQERSRTHDEDKFSPRQSSGDYGNTKVPSMHWKVIAELALRTTRLWLCWCKCAVECALSMSVCVCCAISRRFEPWWPWELRRLKFFIYSIHSFSRWNLYCCSLTMKWLPFSSSWQS